MLKDTALIMKLTGRTVLKIKSKNNNKKVRHIFFIVISRGQIGNRLLID